MYASTSRASRSGARATKPPRRYGPDRQQPVAQGSFCPRHLPGQGEKGAGRRLLASVPPPSPRLARAQRAMSKLKQAHRSSPARQRRREFGTQPAPTKPPARPRWPRPVPGRHHFVEHQAPGMGTPALDLADHSRPSGCSGSAPRRPVQSPPLRNARNSVPRPGAPSSRIGSSFPGRRIGAAFVACSRPHAITRVPGPRTPRRPRVRQIPGHVRYLASQLRNHAHQDRARKQVSPVPETPPSGYPESGQSSHSSMVSPAVRQPGPG